MQALVGTLQKKKGWGLKHPGQQVAKGQEGGDAMLPAFSMGTRIQGRDPARALPGCPIALPWDVLRGSLPSRRTVTRHLIFNL